MIQIILKKRPSNTKLKTKMIYENELIYSAEYTEV